MVSGATKMWSVLLSTVWAVLCIHFAALQPLQIADVGGTGLECGRLVPVTRGLARTSAVNDYSVKLYNHGEGPY